MLWIDTLNANCSSPKVSPFQGSCAFIEGALGNLKFQVATSNQEHSPLDVRDVAESLQHKLLQTVCRCWLAQCDTFWASRAASEERILFVSGRLENEQFLFLPFKLKVSTKKEPEFLEKEENTTLLKRKELCIKCCLPTWETHSLNCLVPSLFRRVALSHSCPSRSITWWIFNYSELISFLINFHKTL